MTTETPLGARRVVAFGHGTAVNAVRVHVRVEVELGIAREIAHLQ